MSPRIPPDQVSPYPGGGSCASRDVRRLDDRDLILKRRRGTRYGDAPVDDSDDYFLTALQATGQGPEQERGRMEEGGVRRRT